MYIRTVNIDRGGEKYGTYDQALRSYREADKVTQDVIHLGKHTTADEASTAWAEDVRQLQTTRPRKAAKLRVKLEKLRGLIDT